MYVNYESAIEIKYVMDVNSELIRITLQFPGT